MKTLERIKEEEDHFDYIMAKSKKTQDSWKRIMQAKGSFSDFEEPTPIKTNTESRKNTKNTKDIPTTDQDIQRQQRIEKFLSEVFD